MIPSKQITVPITSILLAEDDLEHCYFFKKALRNVAPQAKFNAAHDGDALMFSLQKSIPSLLFLDLDIPIKTGVECIKLIRDNKAYDVMPIVVFTISNQANVIQTTYGFGANLYFIKPTGLSQLVNSLQTILLMDWSDPRTITEKHFQNNKYVPFETP